MVQAVVSLIFLTLIYGKWWFPCLFFSQFFFYLENQKKNRISYPLHNKTHIKKSNLTSQISNFTQKWMGMCWAVVEFLIRTCHAICERQQTPFITKDFCFSFLNLNNNFSVAKFVVAGQYDFAWIDVVGCDWF